ncbi:hypothetical protein [Paenibacillus phytohabitans]|uniref:hypothetical protein n=1 Tax=Paenibacillus phytohabitans TaxID=2654978 RepID=UPI001492DA6A|nr:hypothetical protein [Paenibacillus phytohabitans]
MIKYLSLDGTPDAGKLARPVWRRGKAGDYIKRLPIATDSYKTIDLRLIADVYCELILDKFLCITNASKFKDFLV